MTALELLMEKAEHAYWRGQKDQEFRRPMRVGEFFNKLSEEDKEKLRTLKSDDLRKIRPSEVAWMCHPPHPSHRVIIATNEDQK